MNTDGTIKKIRKEAQRWASRLCRWYVVDVAEIESELGLAYAEAVASYDHDKQVPFGSFLRRVFRNRMLSMIRGLDRRAERADLDTALERGMAFEPFDDYELTAMDFGNALDGSRWLFAEMVNPSPAVCRKATEIVRQGGTNNKGLGCFQKAVADVYGLPERQVKHGIQKIRKQWREEQ